MGFEAAQQAMSEAASKPAETTSPSEDTGASAHAPSSNGDLAPDSGETEKASNVFDLTKAEKFLWEGKEMTPDDLRKEILRQQDYTKKTQAVAEQRRQLEEERRTWTQQQELNEQFESNIDADIQNVLRDPSLIDKFKEVYPAKYHAKIDQAMNKSFGDPNSPDRSQSLLEQRLKSIEGRFQSQDMERAKQAFEQEVQSNAAILESNIARLASKYPNADEDSVLAKAEYMAASIKKDENFEKNFTQVLEKLYKENDKYHEDRYKQIYKQKVESQKQANSRGRDIGKGGATPATPPTKIKLKDVKNHILEQMGN